VEEPGTGSPGRVDDALAKALSYLAKRDRTRLQVQRRLEEQGVAAEVVLETLDELERLDYVNDERFARTYAEDRRSLDGWGSERIEVKLQEAGIPDALIAAAVGARDREEEIAGALEVLERKLAGVPPTDDRGRERALGLLVRRGYEMELAYDAIRAFEREAA